MCTLRILCYRIVVYIVSYVYWIPCNDYDYKIYAPRPRNVVKVQLQAVATETRIAVRSTKSGMSGMYDDVLY